ncbi:MAG TPA: ABC transporter ATP-binding protein [Candidatus Saccharimonadales bacterium]|jgi:NitT/TauT family transport system ATP-binding protein|nr:ABC transporter ATP-binding protein [Candidatus Saccharimonadales bacterium]
MTKYVIDLFNFSIGGGQVQAENRELPEPLKADKKTSTEPRPGCAREPAPEAAPKESIELCGVFRSYANARGSFTPALQNIDLEIEQGEFVCIVGPSGCGKSTLLHLVAGLDKPTTGQVLVDGNPVKGPGTDRILLFQELGLFPWLTVRQNVEFGLKMASVSKEERKDRARIFLRMVHLSHFEDHYIHQLSGGMKQRVALARSLALRPKILLMDEPFAALDAQTRDMLHDELERIWKETAPTIIFVTHNVREAVRLGDRVLLMSFRPGRIKKQFNVNLARPRHVEDSDVAQMSKEILGQLREEIDRSFNAEYSREEKP